MSKKYYCDLCKAEMINNKEFDKIIILLRARTLDICDECREVIKKVMKGLEK